MLNQYDIEILHDTEITINILHIILPNSDYIPLRKTHKL
jgi:hypothetical protein